MKSEDLTDSIFDEIFLAVLEEKKKYLRLYPHFIKTFDLAEMLWKKYRIPYKRDADLVREKMRAWWNGKPWVYTPRPHKKIVGIAVYLSSPMNYDYCLLQKGIPGKSVISIYDNQKEFKSVEDEVKIRRDTIA